MIMKNLIKKLILFLGFLFFSLSVFPQCDIRNFIYPDGSMFYYIEPLNFYWTKSKDLKGGVVTDKENYFLALQPSPFPEKPLGNKLKDDLELKLANDSVYILKHFDTRYLDHDSSMQMLFMIDKKSLEDFLNFEVISVKINMEGTEGIRTYVFKLHKSAIREQLDCFLKEEENNKKK
jgi:hypothetical protein